MILPKCVQQQCNWRENNGKLQYQYAALRKKTSEAQNHDMVPLCQICKYVG